MIFRCGNGASGGKGFVKEGSERAELRCVDTIRINKLGADDSGFRNFPHDISHTMALWCARQESNLRPASETSTYKKHTNTLNNCTLSKTS